MLIIDKYYRIWYKKEHGKELPKDKYYGVDFQWSEQELEMAEKYLNGKCFNDFTGNDLLEYSKDYYKILLEKYNNNLSKESIFIIIETLKELFETKILKNINFTLLKLVIDYKITYDEKPPEITFDKYLIDNLKKNENYQEWLEN